MAVPRRSSFPREPGPIHAHPLLFSLVVEGIEDDIAAVFFGLLLFLHGVGSSRCRQFSRVRQSSCLSRLAGDPATSGPQKPPPAGPASRYIPPLPLSPCPHVLPHLTAFAGIHAMISVWSSNSVYASTETARALGCRDSPSGVRHSQTYVGGDRE